MEGSMEREPAAAMCKDPIEGYKQLQEGNIAAGSSATVGSAPSSATHAAAALNSPDSATDPPARESISEPPADRSPHTAASKREDPEGAAGQRRDRSPGQASQCRRPGIEFSASGRSSTR